MSTPVPTPASVKRLIDQKKALETEKPEIQKPVPTRKETSSNTSKKPSESRSQNGKGRSSKPRKKATTSSPSSKVETQTEVSQSSLIEVPIQFKASTPTTPSSTKSKESKKAFVRPEHLTSRPFGQNPDLIALKTSLTQSSTQKSASRNRGRTKPDRGTTSTIDRSERGKLITKIEQTLEQQSRAKHGKKENN